MNFDLEYWIWGTHSSDYEVYGLLDCNAVHFGEFGVTYRLYLQVLRTSQERNKQKQTAKPSSSTQ
jgi:hypothetical protein